MSRPWPKGVGFGDRRKARDFPLFLPEHVSDEVVFVQPFCDAQLTVAETPSDEKRGDGRYKSWRLGPASDTTLHT
jgi:hypothetical protein